MKSIKRVGPSLNKLQKYPYLGILKNGSDVVLFTEPGNGIVVYGTVHKIGFCPNKWTEKLFEEFEGEIILRND